VKRMERQKFNDEIDDIKLIDKKFN
jgi:hypothetical protein